MRPQQHGQREAAAFDTRLRERERKGFYLVLPILCLSLSLCFMPDLHQVKRIACGWTHSMAVTGLWTTMYQCVASNCKFHSVSSQSPAACLVGEVLPSVSWVMAISSPLCNLSRSQYVAFRSYQLGPCSCDSLTSSQFFDGKNVTHIAAGLYHSIAVIGTFMANARDCRGLTTFRRA